MFDQLIKKLEDKFAKLGDHYLVTLDEQGIEVYGGCQHLGRVFVSYTDGALTAKQYTANDKEWEIIQGIVRDANKPISVTIGVMILG